MALIYYSTAFSFKKMETNDLQSHLTARKEQVILTPTLLHQPQSVVCHMHTTSLIENNLVYFKERNSRHSYQILCYKILELSINSKHLPTFRRLKNQSLI